MEEKERYKDCHIAYNCADENGVEDTLTGKQMNVYDIVDLLNQQDKEIQQLKQSQKQLAISELEKVKDILWASQDIGNLIDNDMFLGKLDNQIKSLKGGE